MTSKLTFGPKHSNIFCFVVNSATSGEGPEVYAEMLTKNMTPYVTTQVNIILEFNKTWNLIVIQGIESFYFFLDVAGV